MTRTVRQLEQMQLAPISPSDPRWRVLGPRIEELSSVWQATIERKYPSIRWRPKKGTEALDYGEVGMWPLAELCVLAAVCLYASFHNTDLITLMYQLLRARTRTGRLLCRSRRRRRTAMRDRESCVSGCLSIVALPTH
jgi:hypothetical protein